MAAVAEEGALPQSWINKGEGFSGGGTFEDPVSRKARLKQATESRLSFYISEFKEVEYANVEFDKVTEGGLRRRGCHIRRGGRLYGRRPGIIRQSR